MARGFGTAHPQRRNSKRPHSRSEAEIEAEIEAFLQQDQQANPDGYIQAWRSGVYNPLNGLELKARALSSQEMHWLFLARQIGWLQVQDELAAVYFTAPPPRFAPEQADWYLRPDLVTWLEEPLQLQQAVVGHPIPPNRLLEAIDCHRKQLNWNPIQIETLIQTLTTKSKAELTNEDWAMVLLALQKSDSRG